MTAVGAEPLVAEDDRLYRLIVEAAPAAMILVAGDGKIVLVNTQTEVLFGYPRASLPGRAFETLVPERCRRDVRVLQEQLPKGRVQELSGLRHDGAEIAIEMGFNPAPVETGGFVVSILDVTERRKTEDRSQLFRSLVEGVRDYEILLLDPGGYIMTWNEGAARIKGYSADEIIGKHFSCFYPAEDAKAGRPVMELEMARLHGKYTEEGQRLRRDGSPFWASVAITSLLNEDGSLRGFLKITRDITARRVAETALRESEQELRLLADAMPQIVWTARADGYLDYYNRRWYDFTGYPDGDGGDESWMPILHPGDVQAYVDTWYAAVESGRQFEIQSRFRDRASGLWRWHLGRALPLRDDRGNIVKWVGTFTDIDDHKRLSDELEHRVEQRTLDLQRSLLEKTTLLKEVHHRVKNNLQVICSLLSMQIECAGEEGLSRPLRDAHHRVLAMSLVHEQLYQSETLSDLNFGEYIESLAGQLFYAYCVDPARVRLELEVEPFPLTVDHAVPCGLILNELLANSLKHAFPGSREGVIRVTFKRVDGGRTELSVADTGVGLAPGFRYEESQSLGLQVVRTLVAQLRGNLHVSQEGGTAFRFDWSPS